MNIKNMDIPRPEFPRPQLVRDTWMNLNGKWDFLFDFGNSGCARGLMNGDVFDSGDVMEITVPFCPESRLSGIGYTDFIAAVWYRRHFEISEKQLRGRVLLHFGAVDQQADVFLNGEHAASHAGGYLHFCCEIKDAAPGKEITIVVRVRDMTDRSFHSRGKQTLRPGGIWYTPQSGIWQSVWMEPVPEEFIEKLVITPDLDEECVRITVKSQTAAPCAIRFGGKTYTGNTNEEITIGARDLELWTPDTPILHDFSVQMGRDRVESYFAMRKFSTMRDERGVLRLALNDRILFHSGLLDQGYWPDGLYTAPDDRAFIRDITLAKQMGFNVLRKHIKVEPLRFYYHCDRLGMIVWQDMPCGGRRYDPLIVSTPLVTGWHLDDSWYPLFGRTNVTARKAFLNELRNMVTTLYNHPCIAVWVPFNEGWGQFDSQTAVQVIQSVDKTRTIDPASGWHDQGFGDVRSLHVYFQKYRFQPDKLGRATLLSEFGGYVHRVEGHAVGGKSVGYKTCDAPLSLEYALQALYDEQIRPAIAQGLSAAVYTQLSDVEHELNGLVTYDRSVVKLPVQTLHKIFYIENE